LCAVLFVFSKPVFFPFFPFCLPFFSSFFFCILFVRDIKLPIWSNKKCSQAFLFKSFIVFLPYLHQANITYCHWNFSPRTIPLDLLLSFLWLISSGHRGFFLGFSTHSWLGFSIFDYITITKSSILTSPFLVIFVYFLWLSYFPSLPLFGTMIFLIMSFFLFKESWYDTVPLYSIILFLFLSLAIICFEVFVIFLCKKRKQTPWAQNFDFLFPFQLCIPNSTTSL